MARLGSTQVFGRPSGMETIAGRLRFLGRWTSLMRRLKVEEEIELTRDYQGKRSV